MSYLSPIESDVDAYPYRNVYRAALELVTVIDHWRCKATSPKARTQLDWEKARKELRGGIEALKFCLAPPLVDGKPQAWGESFNPKFKGWLDVAGDLFKTREKRVFVAAGFAGLNACEVAQKLGEATESAFYFLEKAKDKKHYDKLVTAHTVVGGFGFIQRQDIQLIKTECLIEAEDAWLKFGQPGSEQNPPTATDAEPLTPTPPQVEPRLVVDIPKLTAILDGTPISLNSVQVARWLAVLSAKEGVWISGPNLKDHDKELDGARTDLLRKQLPRKLKSLVKTSKQHGARFVLPQLKK